MTGGYDPTPAFEGLWAAIEAMPDPLVELTLRGGCFDPDEVDESALDPVSRDVHSMLAPVYREILQLVRLSHLRRKSEARKLRRAFVADPTTQPWSAGDTSGEPDRVLIVEDDPDIALVDDNAPPPSDR